MTFLKLLRLFFCLTFGIQLLSLTCSGYSLQLIVQDTAGNLFMISLLYSNRKIDISSDVLHITIIRYIIRRRRLLCP